MTVGQIDPTWTVTSRDGTGIAVYDFGGDGDVLLIAHATGLCAGAYQMLAEELSRVAHVVALDFRGHGQSELPLDGDVEWARMAQDVLAVTERFAGDAIHGFGHSMGGSALLLAEVAQPGLFRSLFVYEPIIMSGSDAPTEDQNVMAEAARRRRTEFGSFEEILFRYAAKFPFDQVAAGSALGYVSNGFRRDDDGVVRLRCSPDTEARIFEFGRLCRLEHAGDVSTATVVAVGREAPAPNAARLSPPLAEALMHGTLKRYEHLEHFGPLQDPWTIARGVSAHIARA